MSSTTTSAASATSSADCGANLYNIPVQDPAVGIRAGGNHTDIMAACCGAADVISYYSGCGLYCLAEGQSVNDVINCAYDKGAPYQDVFYRGNVNATATVTGTALPTSADASVVVTGGSTKATSSGASGSDSSASSTSSPGAAANVRPELGSLSTMGLTIGALLLSATAFGAFQL
ncbi:hypothetical protein F4781DRAFT_21274 [Annulohypoxylon bovei var. microspora]|nr:hypothetical protein F4781DRAFT_21274 [Annulohypoxylon bovei var. microspora]